VACPHARAPPCARSAERFLDGRLSDRSLARMTDEAIEAALNCVPGIGPWTAHGFLIVALDRPDVLLSGDLALRRAVERAYRFDHLPTEDEMVQVAERWRPYRSPRGRLPVRVRARDKDLMQQRTIKSVESRRGPIGQAWRRPRSGPAGRS